ncbi:hypothetical protein [Massilicoli timonensis]
MRYLEEYHRVTYTILLTSGKFNSYLATSTDRHRVSRNS